MTIYHDDNYGTWEDMDEPEAVEFYRETQRTNVRKRCLGCGAMVSIQPHYAYCNGCANILERGGDLPGYDRSVELESEFDDEEDLEEPELTVEPCFVCKGKGEDCTCEEGSTNEDGEPNYCYDCGRSYANCNCFQS